MNKILISMVLLWVAVTAQGSQEGVLALSSFHLESAGIGKSGKVIVDGKQNDRMQMTSLTVKAFDKEFIVPKEKLADMEDVIVNGVRISYERGYVETGGRAIYLQLQMGFTSRTVKQVIIILSEDGKIEVQKAEKNTWESVTRWNNISVGMTKSDVLEVFKNATPRDLVAQRLAKGEVVGVSAVRPSDSELSENTRS